MGSLTLCLSIFAVCFVLSITETAGSGSCPLQSKAHSCSPKCQQNYECSHGKLCCPNSCNAKSCMEPAPHGADRYTSTAGSGIYCGNVKCNHHEKCVTDQHTGRQKCGRA